MSPLDTWRSSVLTNIQVGVCLVRFEVYVNVTQCLLSWLKCTQITHDTTRLWALKNILFLKAISLYKHHPMTFKSLAQVESCSMTWSQSSKKKEISLLWCLINYEVFKGGRALGASAHICLFDSIYCSKVQKYVTHEPLILYFEGTQNVDNFPHVSSLRKFWRA